VRDDSGTDHADRTDLPQSHRGEPVIHAIAGTTSFAGHPAHLPPRDKPQRPGRAAAEVQ